MTAFAANSLIGRAALADDLIDPASFTTVRVASAALVLALVVYVRRRRLPSRRYADWRSGLALFSYAALFSFAYRALSAGTGALILFGAVQLTMFARAFYEREHFPPLAWGGMAIACGGLVWLVLPGVSAPDPLGTVLMVGSGVAWGVFSLLARGTEHPVEANAVNFAFCVPFAVVGSAIFMADAHWSPGGLALAMTSGGLTSGIGYVLWYALVQHISAARAAVLQLSAPAVAALGGVVLLGEDLTLRLVVATAAMLGGVAIVLAQKARQAT